MNIEKEQIIECVPNISEGNNPNIIKQITDQIEKVDGAHLINTDSGKGANRTVITFIGNPTAVIEAAFRVVKKAAELIDMRVQKGTHPRFGATDVCPLIPIANISIEETVKYTHQLAKRIGIELGIPVYCYEFAASNKVRSNLANCRAGEYEGLKQKLIHKDWKPDYGPAEFNASVAKTGAVAISARNILIAYNVNLNTKSVKKANAIAFDVREKGKAKRVGEITNGKLIKNEKGETIYEPGLLKSVKGIGWFIDEYNKAQVSYNLTNIKKNSIHNVFDTTCTQAEIRGVKVTGSELIGLVPLKALLDAGKHYSKEQGLSGLPDRKLIELAIKTMGLEEFAPFEPRKRIIEYLLEDLY